MEAVADMIPTSYETCERAPRRPAIQHRRVGIPATILLGSVLILGGCGRDASKNDAGDGATVDSGSQTMSDHLSAADRDASLDAIERWLTAGRADAAITIARTLAQRLPDDPHVALALGRSLLAQSSEARLDPVRGPERAAALSSEAVVALQPAYEAWRSRGAEAAEARRSLGLALEGAGRLPDAIGIYTEADVHEDPISRLHLGLALLRDRRAEEAASVLSEVESVRPDDAFVVSARAETALMLERPDEARELADRAVRLDSDSWPIRVRRASILRRTGDPRAAVESLLAMDETSRLERPLLEELTEGCLALNRPDAAANAWATLARARRDDPGASIDAALKAAELYALAGQDEESVIWLDIARDLDPADRRIQASVERIERIRVDRAIP